MVYLGLIDQLLPSRTVSRTFRERYMQEGVRLRQMYHASRALRSMYPSERSARACAVTSTSQADEVFFLSCTFSSAHKQRDSEMNSSSLSALSATSIAPSLFTLRRLARWSGLARVSLILQFLTLDTVRRSNHTASAHLTQHKEQHGPVPTAYQSLPRALGSLLTQVTRSATTTSLELFVGSRNQQYYLRCATSQWTYGNVH